MTRAESRELFAAATRDGGFTYDTHSHTHPCAGYAFSQAPENERRLSALSARAIRAYARDNARALSAPGAHLGAWHENGTWYLDVSVVHDDMAAAVARACAAAQKALYDLSTGSTITLSLF